MKRRVHRKTKKRFKNAMRGFIKDLSRPVLVYLHPVKHECPNCYFDKLTGRSTGNCKWTLTEARQQQIIYEANGGVGTRYKYFARGRCPVCKGQGFLEIQRRMWIDCKITWDPSLQGYDNKMVYTPAGHEGATTIELKTDPKYIEIFSNSIKLIIDDIECKMSKAPINRGLGNETVLKVTAFTTDKLKKDPKDVMKIYDPASPAIDVLGIEDGQDLYGLDDGSLLEI
jgi:hypothetical protein